MLSGEALAAQRDNFIGDGLRCGFAEPMQARRKVRQPFRAGPAEPFGPFAGGFGANVEGVSDFRDRLAAFYNATRYNATRYNATRYNATRQFRSTVRRQTSILMDVHPGLRERVKYRNSTFLSEARMDNL
jgi:hypothetical protein